MDVLCFLTALLMITLENSRSLRRTYSKNMNISVYFLLLRMEHLKAKLLRYITLLTKTMHRSIKGERERRKRSRERVLAEKKKWNTSHLVP